MIQEILATYPLPLLVAASYAGFGLLFALVFITFLVNIMDIHARGGSFGFRIIILPAAMLLWPLIMLITVGKVSLIISKHLIAKKKEKEKIKRKEAKKEKQKANTQANTKVNKNIKSNKISAVNVPKALKVSAAKQGVKNKAVQDKSPATKLKAAKRNKKTT